MCACERIREGLRVHKYDSADDEPAQIVVSLFSYANEPERIPPPPLPLFSPSFVFLGKRSVSYN